MRTMLWSLFLLPFLLLALAWPAGAEEVAFNGCQVLRFDVPLLSTSEPQQFSGTLSNACLAGISSVLLVTGTAVLSPGVSVFWIVEHLPFGDLAQLVIIGPDGTGVAALPTGAARYQPDSI